MSFTDQTITLDLDKVGVTAAMPVGLQNVKYSVAEDPMMNMLKARLTGYVLSEHLANDTETDQVHIPTNWRQHLKADLDLWAESHPRDLLRPLIRKWLTRRPVLNRTVTLSVTWHRAATRPQSTIRIPDKLGPVIYQEHTTRSW